MWTLVPSFAGTAQQDAHEFTRFLLERLRAEFVKGDSLVKAAAKAQESAKPENAKPRDPGSHGPGNGPGGIKSSSIGINRHQPRGREHGDVAGGVFASSLGIPNPTRRSRSLRLGGLSGARGGKWTDSPGSNTPTDSPQGGGSPGGGGLDDDYAGGTPANRQLVSPRDIAAGLTAAAMRGGFADAGNVTPVTKRTATTHIPQDDDDDDGGFMIVSRWGAVRHKRSCPCRPCKSRRKADGDDEAYPQYAFPGAPVDGAETETQSNGGFPGSPVPKRTADALVSSLARTSPTPRSPGREVKKKEREPVDSVSAGDETGMGPFAARVAATPVARGDGDEKPIHQIDLTTPPSAGQGGLDKDGLPTDPVWRMFGGMALSRICCTRCGHASTRREPFLDISLPIPPVKKNEHAGENGDENGSGSPASPRIPPGAVKDPVEVGNGPNGCVTLQQCLAAHTKDETLAGPGRFYCERCGDVGGATKQNKLQTLPPVLCLHLKRFTWRGTGSRSKLNVHVDFPLHGLDLSPYMESWELDEVEGAHAGPTGRAAAETAAAAADAAAEMAETCAEIASAASKSGGRPRRVSGSYDAFNGSLAAKAAAAEQAANQAQEAAAMAMANWIDADETSVDERGVRRNCMYDLAACVVHHGAGAGSGHYTVFARRGDNSDDNACVDGKGTGTVSGGRDAKGTGTSGKSGTSRKPHPAAVDAHQGRWSQFNDDKVLPADPEDVRGSGGYLFFYTRREAETDVDVDGGGEGNSKARGRR